MSKIRWFRSTTSSRILWKCLLLLILCPALAALAAAPEDVMLYLPLEDAQNPVDASDNPTSVVVYGTVGNTDGQFGSQALQLDGNNANRLEVVHADKLEGMAAITIEAWVMPQNTASHEGMSVLSKRVANTDGDVYNMFVWTGNTVRARISATGELASTTALQDDTWYHLAFVFDGGATGDKTRLYVNGVQEASGTHAATSVATGGAPLWIGELDAARGFAWDGVLDEIGIWNIPLTQEEVNQIMNEGKAKMFRSELAWNPKPADGAEEVLPATDLSWNAGTYAAAHNVYFGTAWEDVNSASLDNPLDVLTSENQDVNSFDLDKLTLGQTYFWRIDEVNAPPDHTVFKGDIWSFTVEPVSYPFPIGAVSATASSTADGQDPNNTVNGSGLNESDQHANDQQYMWLGADDDITPSIQFDLSQIEKLDKVHVWNHNTQTEAILGFGIKEALIETSVDGETWSEFGQVELPQASGMADYGGADVSLGGVMARFVRITGLSNHSILGLPQKGLSEVRFYVVPVLASDPVPADGITSDGVDVTLQWRTGREAVEHEVVFSADEQSVIDGSAVVATVSESSYDLGTLDLGMSYFWKINEMNDLGTPPAYEGDLWTFLTPDHLMVDDFEMYQAKDGLFIWQHWIDGFDNPADNGAVVGNGDDAEKSVVYEGSQSLPMEYDNSSAPKSEATRYFDPFLDLTPGNPESVGLYYHGMPAGVVENSDGTISVSGIGADIAGTTDELNFVYKTLTGDGSITARVDSIPHVHDWAKAGVMMRTSLEPDDVYVMGIATPLNRTEILSRAVSGAGAAGANTPADSTPLPYWVRITRAGNLFTVESSADGTAWQSILPDDAAGSEAELFMPDPIYMGLCVTSHDAAVPVTAEFSNVSATGNVSAGWQQEAMTVEQPNNGAAPLYMVLTDSAGKSARIETDDAAATTATQWILIDAAVGDLNVDLSQIASISVGVDASGVEGKIFVDAVRTARPYPAAAE